MDISDTIAPNSDQLDAVDLIGGPRTFTISDISKGNPEQPVNIHLAEFPRPWRPGKSMRRVLVAAWGPNAAEYVGRRVTLYCDPNVMFGKDKVGGTRIKALSHIDKPVKVSLLVSRGKSAMFSVDVLPDVAPQQADPQRTQQAFGAFEQIGVTRDHLEQRIGRPVEQWTPDDLTNLQAFYTEAKAAAAVEGEDQP